MIANFIDYCESQSLNLLEQAHGHKIVSLVADYADKNNINLSAEFQEAWQQKSALNILIEQASQKIAESQLRVSGIKGIMLRQEFNYYLRDLSDLDLLVLEKPYLVYQELKKLDYTCVVSKLAIEYASQQEFSKEIYNNHSFEMTNQHGLGLDCHVLVAEPFVCNQDVTEYCLSLARNQRDLELAVIILLVQGYKNNWQELQLFFDLDYLSKNYQLDLTSYHQVLAELGLEKIYFKTVELFNLFNNNFNLLITKQQQLSNLSEMARINKFSSNQLQAMQFLFKRFCLPFGPDLRDDSFSVALFSKLKRNTLKLLKSFN